MRPPECARCGERFDPGTGHDKGKTSCAGWYVAYVGLA